MPDVATAPVTVWGLAAGRGSTRKAAWGAFTLRDYSSLQAAQDAQGDWLEIAVIERHPRKEKDR